MLMVISERSQIMQLWQQQLIKDRQLHPALVWGGSSGMFQKGDIFHKYKPLTF